MSEEEGFDFASSATNHFTQARIASKNYLTNIVWNGLFAIPKNPRLSGRRQQSWV